MRILSPNLWRILFWTLQVLEAFSWLGELEKVELDEKTRLNPTRTHKALWRELFHTENHQLMHGLCSPVSKEQTLGGGGKRPLGLAGRLKQTGDCLETPKVGCFVRPPVHRRAYILNILFCHI